MHTPRTKTRWPLVPAAAVAVSLLAACSSSGSQSGSKGASSGGDITIGIVTSTTGPVAALSVDAAKARFDQQNSVGGVNGHKIKMVVGDDGGTAQGAQTA